MEKTVIVAAIEKKQRAAKLRETLASILPGGMRCVMNTYCRRTMDGKFVIGGDGAAMFSSLTLDETVEVILWQAEIGKRE